MTNSKPSRPRPYPRVSISLDSSGGANPDDAAGTDINTIMAHYKKHGVMPAVHTSNPLYGDFTFGDDLHEIRTAMFEAEERFNQLPSGVRTAADNDWGTFVAMFDDPQQQETLISAGLIVSENPVNPQPPSYSTPSPADTPQSPSDKTAKTDET